MGARKLYFDRSRSPQQALVKSETGGDAPAPQLIYGDNNPVEVYMTDGQGGFDSDSGAVGVTLKVGIVTPGSNPTSGTYKLQYNAGTKSAAIAYNASAATIETALDAIAGVSVAVTGSFPCYEIEWDSTGAQNDITAATGASDDNALTPDGAISVSKLVDGDGSNKEKLLLEIRRAPHTLQTSWTRITDGWSGVLPTRTKGLCELLGTSSSVNTTLEVEITDASGDIYTVAQVACTVRAHGIDTGSPALNTPEDYYTETEADNLFLKKAQNLADLADAATARTNLGISGANTPYAPAVAGDWSSTPAEVKEALDELADRTNGVSATKTALTAYTPSAAGSTNIDPNDAHAITTHMITPGAGAGAYTHDYILQQITPGETAPIVMIHINMPESANPTIRIYDEGATDPTSDDVLEISISGSANTAKQEVLILAWDNSNTEWDLIFSSVGRADGLQSIVIPAAAMIPRTTNGAAESTAESATNKIMQKSLDFDATTNEYAQFSIALPKSWDATTALIARVHWQTAGTSGDVIWGIQAVCVENNAVIDAAFGTAGTVTDTTLNASRNHVSDWTSDITPADAASDAMTWFQVYRDAAAVGDTLATDAKLIGVEILYKATNGSEDL